jgi:hypothetical protein
MAIIVLCQSPPSLREYHLAGNVGRAIIGLSRCLQPQRISCMEYCTARTLSIVIANAKYSETRACAGTTAISHRHRHSQTASTT